ncbi:hypothetical protein JOC37_000289 [Desulfohalotomaculum tongense]|uniref:prenyltransferase/squalene oxidase repeat-containing protein n=1 Tax=Desulforadius tongensis TaxID=1216062 RepID=UPI00195CE5C3|nr:hypothetical protein [Desulforadius tongensis]
MFKKLLSLLLVSCLVLFSMVTAPVSYAAPAADEAEIENAIAGAVRYLQKEMLAPDYEGVLDWAILGFYAAGKDVEILSRKREAQIKNGEMISEFKNTDYQRTILAALAAGKKPDEYGGRKLVAKVKASQMVSGKFADSVNGTGERLVNAHIWGIISLYAAGEDIPNADKALQWLVEHQNTDGGFGIDTEIQGSDVDITAMAIIAMACLGQDDRYPPVQRALAYLKKQQNDDGSFGAWGTPAAESCAQVVQALVMLGLDPAGDEWSKGGGNPVTGMLKYRLKDGSFSHGSELLPNDMATVQALLALTDYYTGQSIYSRLRLAQRPVVNNLPAGSETDTMTKAVRMKPVID